MSQISTDPALPTEAVETPAKPASPPRARPIAKPASAMPEPSATPDVEPTLAEAAHSGTALVTLGASSPEPKVTTIMSGTEHLVAFSQANVEAVIKAGQIWSTGLQDLSKKIAANAQSAMDETTAALKAMTGVTSLREAIELQTGLARTSVEKAMRQSNEFTETSIKLAEQTLAPITERLQHAAKSFSPNA